MPGSGDRRRVVVATVLGLLALLVPSPTAATSAPAALAGIGATAQAAPTVPAAKRLNIVLILTDDLDARSVETLPNVASLLRDQGTSFANAFVTTPLCCPSRASILRGQYAHNTGVLTNVGETGGFATFRRLGREESTVATWLDDAGYRTALFGKYLNGYPKGAGRTHVPPGWDEWAGLTETGLDFYIDYELNENGRLVSYGGEPDDYLTDVLSAKATDFVERMAETDQPFFLYLAPYAPHSPATPASRHEEALADLTAPRPPSFNETDVSDKPAWVRDHPELDPEQIARVDERYRKRLRSLLAVDEMVAGLVKTLEATGTLDNTYMFFTSDNGFHLGEHRLPLGKQSPYDEAVRVPLIVRGPGVPAGGSVEALALNIDLAPTFAALAGVAAPDFVDGRSLAPLIRGEDLEQWRRGFLVELFGVERGRERGASREAAGAENGSDIDPAHLPPYRALRTADLLFVEYDDGERELYDRRMDPYELENLAATADPSVLADLASRLADLRECAADGCRVAEDATFGPVQSGSG